MLTHNKHPLNYILPWRKKNIFSVVILMLLIIAGVSPVIGPAPVHALATSLTFIAEVDAQVNESNPTTNYGNSTYIQVDGASDPDVEGFIRFTVAGVSGTVQSATLRIYDTTNGSVNGPAVYGTGTSWTETGITWNNRPSRITSALDNKGNISTSTWVEYNVTSSVTGNGTFSFVLAADSNDAATFSSRQGSQPPQLVITTDNGSTPTLTNTATLTPLPSETPSNTATLTPLPSEIPSNTATLTPLPSITLTNTQISGAALTFITVADSQVKESNPSTNYGKSSSLQVDGASDPDVESFIRFTVTGVSGTVQNATLRVYDTTNGSVNGPAVYGTGTSWTETGITWNNRPSRITGALDNKSNISTNTWVEYNVTSLVTGNGTFSFVLAADSNDAATFSSRQGSQPPQLVVTTDSGSTPTPGNTATPTLTSVITATNTQTSGAALTFITVADSQVKESSPSTNYGNSSSLQADGASDPDVEGFIRFTMAGVSGTIQSAKLRVYVSSNGSVNGPAVYGTGTSWTETGITWNNRPSRITGALDNKSNISTNTWVEYNVTSLVTGNGTFSFVFAADSNDATTFSSRQGSQPPQLVVMVDNSSTPTPNNTATLTSTLAITATNTSTSIASLTPTPSSTPSDSVVLVGAGDISTCSNNNDELTARLLDNIPGTVFTAGDNVYTNGTYTEYIDCYGPTWGRHKSRTQPVPGNHEYNTAGAAGYFQYFSNIDPYYAYDLGAWRIYALNSEIDASASSAQMAWLQADLAANPNLCVLAYWHKPRWSSGFTHGNNSSMQTMWQVLYNAGAELVVNGHEHNYERFAEMDTSGSAISQGLREFVVGTGGAGLYPFGSILPTSQVRNSSAFGVLKLTLNAGSYDWQFVPVAGATFTDSGSSACH